MCDLGNIEPLCQRSQAAVYKIKLGIPVLIHQRDAADRSYDCPLHKMGG